MASIETTRRMMQDDAEWVYTTLPMKRFRHGRLEFAILARPVATGEHVSLYKGTLILNNQFTDLAHTYASIEACIADGWSVD